MKLNQFAPMAIAAASAACTGPQTRVPSVVPPAVMFDIHKPTAGPQEENPVFKEALALRREQVLENIAACVTIEGPVCYSDRHGQKEGFGLTEIVAVGDYPYQVNCNHGETLIIDDREGNVLGICSHAEYELIKASLCEGSQAPKEIQKLAQQEGLCEPIGEAKAVQFSL